MIQGETFGETPDGRTVHRQTIAGGGLTLNVLDYGTVIQDARLDGHEPPLCLGFDSFEPYLTHSPYFGATAGRCLNRITNGQFQIDGKSYQADRNMGGKHTLHGGARGMGKRVWELVDIRPDRITLELEQEDGDMGFPGRLVTRLTYACLDGGIFDIQIEAKTDATTLCNIGHHSYWNLDGEPNLNAHRMQIDADRYTEVDADFLPTGHLPSVAGTIFDFRVAKPVLQAPFIDHNLCTADGVQDLRKIGAVWSEKSDVTMEIWTTEPGLQVYDAYKVDIDLPGLDGRIYRKNAGLALEPQNWPDAINHEGFPDPILRPGNTYRQHTQFRFSKG